MNKRQRQLHEEINKRILKRDREIKDHKESKDRMEAAFDALGDVTDVPRREMQQIADDVLGDATNAAPEVDSGAETRWVKTFFIAVLVFLGLYLLYTALF